jgi:hypothetical protein
MKWDGFDCGFDAICTEEALNVATLQFVDQCPNLPQSKHTTALRHWLEMCFLSPHL